VAVKGLMDHQAAAKELMDHQVAAKELMDHQVAAKEQMDHQVAAKELVAPTVHKISATIRRGIVTKIILLKMDQLREQVSQ